MIIHDVEQGTEPWHTLRAGIPTASEFSKLITSKGAESSSLLPYARRLAADKWYGVCVDGFSGNKFTKRGSEVEDEACADYEMRHQVAVKHVGLITNNIMTQGCSPDGLIEEDPEGKGGLEIKCKIAEHHLEACEHVYNTGTAPIEYVAQPQGCMLITGRKWWDLKFYHPNLPGIELRMYPDKDFHKVLRKQLKTVIRERDEYIKFIKILEEL